MIERIKQWFTASEDESSDDEAEEVEITYEDREEVVLQTKVIDRKQARIEYADGDVENVWYNKRSSDDSSVSFYEYGEVDITPRLSFYSDKRYVELEDPSDPLEVSYANVKSIDVESTYTECVYGIMRVEFSYKYNNGDEVDKRVKSVTDVLEQGIVDTNEDAKYRKEQYVE